MIIIKNKTVLDTEKREWDGDKKKHKERKKGEPSMHNAQAGS